MTPASAVTGQSSGPTVPSVEASLKYLADDNAPVVHIASVGGGDSTVHQGNYKWHRVTIQNGRLDAYTFHLDREGFTLVPQVSVVRDFYDDAEIAGIYEDEVKQLVMQITGAKRVEIFDHTRRASSLAIQAARKIREPATAIHNDYSDASGPRRLRDHFANSPAEVEELLARRFAIVNIWRSIRGTVYRSPMALCDAQSVAAKDLIAVKRQAKERIGEIQAPLYNPAHRWFYFPEMRIDEALFIKTFDSATDGRARFTVHTAFEDPNTPEEAPARESIETRCFAFF